MLTKKLIIPFLLVVLMALFWRCGIFLLKDHSSGNVGSQEAENLRSSRIENRNLKSRGTVSERVAKLWRLWLLAYDMDRPNEKLETYPGATDAEIKAAEKHLKLDFPEDFSAFLRLVNGSAWESSFYQGSYLLSVEQIQENDPGQYSVEEAAQLKHRPTTENWWHPNLIQVSDLSGGGLAIDCVTGEVWDWDHDGGLFGIVATSWSDFLKRSAEAHEAKDYSGHDFIDLDLPYLDEFGKEILDDSDR